MKLDSLAYEMQDFFPAPTGGNAARKVRNVSAKTAWTFLCHNEIAHLGT